MFLWSSRVKMRMLLKKVNWHKIFKRRKLSEKVSFAIIFVFYLFIYLLTYFFINQNVFFRNQSVVILKDWIENYIRKKNQYRMRFSIKFIQYVGEMKFSKKQDFWKYRNEKILRSTNKVSKLKKVKLHILYERY